MSDDYLWDRSGPPDPEIARLEELLRPFGQQESVRAATTARLPTGKTSPPRFPRRWVPLYAAAAAIVLIAGGGWWKVNRSTSASWEVTLFDAAPSAPSRRVTGHRGLPVGGWLETNDAEKALIKVADIGNVNVDPSTRVRLIDTRAGDHRLELVRGTLHATILAPPGQFFVETPSATAVDLGCAYTLTIDDAGAGVLTVTLGWVGFEWHGRESLIPAGFIAATRPELGPGTPRHIDASPAVRDALDAIDFDPASAEINGALDVVLAASAERDEATLWHLLSRVPPSQRDRVFDRLAQFVPPPPNVTRAGIRDGRRDMLDRWWDAMGLGNIAWWRTWKLKGG